MNGFDNFASQTIGRFMDLKACNNSTMYIYIYTLLPSKWLSCINPNFEILTTTFNSKCHLNKMSFICPFGIHDDRSNVDNFIQELNISSAINWNTTGYACDISAPNNEKKYSLEN